MSVRLFPIEYCCCWATRSHQETPTRPRISLMTRHYTPLPLLFCLHRPFRHLEFRAIANGVIRLSDFPCRRLDRHSRTFEPPPKGFPTRLVCARHRPEPQPPAPLFPTVLRITYRNLLLLLLVLVVVAAAVLFLVGLRAIPPMPLVPTSRPLPLCRLSIHRSRRRRPRRHHRFGTESIADVSNLFAKSPSSSCFEGLAMISSSSVFRRRRSSLLEN